MAEKRDKWVGKREKWVGKWIGRSKDDDVEAHRYAPDDAKREKYAEPSDDEDGEVEAHKY
jgi:hypothetical protein